MTPIVAPAMSALSQPRTRAELNADCIGCILAGAPLPEAFAPRPHSVPPVGSAREGIERILGIAGGQLQ